MRLRVMQERLIGNLENLVVQGDKVGGDEYEIKNFPLVYSALNNIADFVFLEEEIIKLASTNVFYNKNDRVILNAENLKEFVEIVVSIHSKAFTVIKALEEAIPKQDENSISFKLPDYVDLSNISKFIKDINNILNQTLVEKYQGTIKLQNFDTGSNWIEVLLSNADAVVYFGYIVKATTELVRGEYVKWKQTEYSIKSLQIEEEAKQLVLKGLEDAFKTKANLNAKMLMDTAGITENQIEYQNELTRSMISLAGYISDGAEVHTALNAPEEVKDVFPDAQEIQVLIEKSLKFLTDGSTVAEETKSNDGTQQPEEE